MEELKICQCFHAIHKLYDGKRPNLYCKMLRELIDTEVVRGNECADVLFARQDAWIEVLRESGYTTTKIYKFHHMCNELYYFLKNK